VYFIRFYRVLNGEGDEIIMVGDVEAESHDDNDDHDEEDSESDEEESDDDGVEDEIVEKFIRMFHNGDYDEEFDIALSMDRAVPTITSSTQASYNKPDNWVERNRIGLEKVKRQLQGLFNEVSQGTFSNLDLRHEKSLSLHLRHNSHYVQLLDNEEPIVWHEPILDEYWNHFEAKIDGRNQQEELTEIDQIEIKNIEMKKDRLAALVAIFCNGRAKYSSDFVAFDNANLCKEGIVSLSKLVEVSSQLQFFYLTHNRIDCMESARCLSTSLKSHNHIRWLYLNHCYLGSSPEILSVILQSDVKHINLSNNNIDSLGAVKIAEYLESDPPIEELCIAYNRLNDDDVILIARALKRNTNLHEIGLRSNNFTSIGVKALLTCVFDASSLNAISESNHTVEEMQMLFRDESHIVDVYIDRLLQLDRVEKILLALNDKESLLKYLANVPVELIPEVLVFPFQRVGNHSLRKHLNIIYSTMRWWNMPMLYSYHQCVKSDAKRKRAD
jgi:hypothetical protein